MATVAPHVDQAADLLQELSVDSQTESLEVPEATKKPSAIPYGTVDAGEANGPFKSCDQSTPPIFQGFMDPTMCHLPNGYPPSTPYYFGGYSATINEWNNYSRIVNPERLEMPPGVFGDNGSLMYPCGYGYTPYGAYPSAVSPLPTMGHGGQMYASQHYQYPTTYYQHPTPPRRSCTPKQAPDARGEISTSVSADQVPSSVDAVNGKANGSVKCNDNGSAPPQAGHLNSSLNGSYGRGVLPGCIPASGCQGPRFGFDGTRSPVPWLDGSQFSERQSRPTTSSYLSSSISHVNSIQSGRNHNIQPLQPFMGLQPPRLMSGMGPVPGFMNRLYPNSRMHGQCGNTARTGPVFRSNGYDSRKNGCGWFAFEGKYRPRGRGNGCFGYGNENFDGFNELNRGPRARAYTNPKAFTPIALAVKGQSFSSNGYSKEEKHNSSLIPDKEQYNREDFPKEYLDAKIFIIKSYSEDDVHKSIKYGVWTSTPNGNKKLDAGYKEAQEKSGGCPVFLFFSVNTSGQFIGLAEMVGPVDFDKNMEYWQQDKWNGSFPVKWHIVKDVPNSLLKHIILENNENKPVTNSRDTQEVKFEQGLQLLKIFKDHYSKTCILDDFGFYEAREKKVQVKRANHQQYQKQVWGGRLTDAAVTDIKDREVLNGKPVLQKSFEMVSTLLREPAAVQGNGEWKLSGDNGSIAGAGDAMKGANSVIVTEKKVHSNGAASAC